MIPATPKKRGDDQLDVLLRRLDSQWGLGLETDEDLYSPNDMAAKSRAAAQCFSHIRLLFFRSPDTLDTVIEAFETAANAAYMSWKSKPNQEQGTLPGQLPCDLFRQLLLQHLEPEAVRVKQHMSLSKATAPGPSSPETLRARKFSDRSTGFGTVKREMPGSVVHKEDPPLSARHSSKKTFKQQKIPFTPIIPMATTVSTNQQSPTPTAAHGQHTISGFGTGPETRCHKANTQIGTPHGPANSAEDDSFWRPDKTARAGSDGMHETREYPGIEDAAQAPQTQISNANSSGNRTRKRSYETTLERVPLNNLPRGDSSPTHSRARIRARGPELNPNGAEEARLSLASSIQAIPLGTETNGANISFSTTKDSRLSSFSTTNRTANTSFTSTGIQEDPSTQISKDVPAIWQSCPPGDRGVSLNRPSESATLSANDSFKQMGVTPIHAPRRFSVSGPAQPDFAADHMEVDVEALITTERSADIYFEHPIYHRLSKYSPFKPMPAGLNNLQLRLRYELTRISLHTGVELSDLSSLSSELSSDYTTFWNQIQQHESLRGKQLPAKSSARAWNAALNDFHEILLSGTLEPITQSEGPMLKLKLSPLQPQQPHRLGRKFGFDRYLKLTVPVLNKDDSEGISRVIFSWLAREEHHMFGRKWSSFYLRNRRKDKKKAFIKEDRNKAPRKEVFLFATDGCDFAGAKKSPFKSQPLRALKPMTAETMLEWLIPFHAKPNQEGRCLKIFSRISLGLTPTEPAIVFDPSQIEWRETDIMSTEDPEQEMNDGCDVISLSAAKAIAKALNIEGSIPSAFQARIAGAKGLWIVDPCENPYLSDPNDFSSPRISISPSQVKFKNHPEDERSECYDQARLTFEVVKYSKPLRSADINLDLIPILTAQGVPKSAFEKLLSDHLSHLVRELQAAVSDGCVFRKWIHDHYFPASHDRESDASRGDLPARKLDQIIMLLEGGFNIQNCWVLKELAFKVLSIHCKRFEDKISIPVGRSTRVYCVPDVTRTLEEGTVHLGFSGKFFDQESGFDDTKLKDIDVLVARSPAVRPYDIQKVRAVVNPELSHLKDVIVFSTQGAIPLAAKLAGGDYDGDTVWVCWDPILVKPFQNADKPDDPKPQDLGIIQDETKIQELPQQNVVTEMVRRSFVFGATGPKLGFCTLYYRRLCYTEGSMTCKGARWIAALLGYLVDQEKQGYIFTDAMWNELKKRPDLVSAKPVDKTAYEDDSATKPTKHILDQLKFFVTKPMIKTALEQFNQPIKEPALYDRDISKLWKHVKARAERDPQIQNLVVSLEKQIRELHTSWSQRMCLRDETDECKTFKSVLDDCFSRYEAISPPEGDHPLISWWANDEEAIWPQDGTSMWNLLKASAVYFFYHMAKFPWYMAGTKLAVLKLKATNRMKPMDEGIHASYKPSASYFRNKREKLAAPVEELVDSEEDEFGDIDDYFDLEGDF